jgi:hypothetical protein
VDRTVIHHQDPEVDKAMIRLVDSLCAWERNTSRGSILIYVPDLRGDYRRILFVQDGKPLPNDVRSQALVLGRLMARVKDGWVGAET